MAKENWEEWLLNGFNGELAEEPEEETVEDSVEESETEFEEHDTESEEPTEEPEDAKEPTEIPPEEPAADEEPKAKPKSRSRKSEDDYKREDILKVIKDMAKVAEKNNARFAGAVKKIGEWFYCIDGYRVLRTQIPLEEVNTDVEMPSQIESFFDDSEHKQQQECMDYETLKREMAEVKKKNSVLQKGKNTFAGKQLLYRLEDGLTVNADYFLSCLLATRSNKFLYKNNKSLIKFISEDYRTEMVCLPVNPVYRPELEPGTVFAIRKGEKK